MFWVAVVSIVAFSFGDTYAIHNVTCSSSGDVYVQAGEPEVGEGSSYLEPESLAKMFVIKENNVCSLESTGASARIYDCFKRSSAYPFKVFLPNGDDGLLIIQIACFPDSVRRRRQDLRNTGKMVATSTSVSFSVHLNFSSNDEITIACNPDNAGTLYISNPKPALFKSLLAFSENSKTRCSTTFLSARNFAAVENCSLSEPIIVAFSVQDNHDQLIGGVLSHFKVYNINCMQIAETSQGFYIPQWNYAEDSGADDQMRASWGFILIGSLFIWRFGNTPNVYLL